MKTANCCKLVVEKLNEFYMICCNKLNDLMIAVNGKMINKQTKLLKKIIFWIFSSVEISNESFLRYS